MTVEKNEKKKKTRDTIATCDDLGSLKSKWIVERKSIYSFKDRVVMLLV